MNSRPLRRSGAIFRRKQLAKKHEKKISLLRKQSNAISDLKLEVRKLESTNFFLSEVLYCCGKAANSDVVAEVAQKALGDFSVPDARFRQILRTLAPNGFDPKI
jgi:hypothetical protein